MIEQKDAMQLIGTWGYDAESLLEHLAKQMEEAKEIGDIVGAVAMESICALTRYAKTSDEKYSMGEKFDKDKLPKSIGEIADILSEWVSDPKFPSEVLETLYEKLSDKKTLEEAQISLRRDVFITVAPLLLNSFSDGGNEVSSSLLQLIVGIDHAKLNNVDNTDEILTKLDHDFGVIQDVSMEVIDNIRMCQNTGDEKITEIFGYIVQDIVDLVSSISRNILSIIDSEPDVWVEFSDKFGRFATAFHMATTLGFITYDTYKDIFDKLTSLSILDNKTQNPIFGRN